MRLICRIVVYGYGLLYLGALGMYVVYGWGLFGHQPEALAGLYLVMIGYPWIGALEWFPEALWPWLGILAPLGNLLALLVLCRWLRRCPRPFSRDR